MRIKIFVIVIVSIFLLGCACDREQLGISELEWSSYSKHKQRTLLVNCVKVCRDRDAVLREGKKSASKNDFLMVEIFDGKVMFPPTFISWQKYKPVKFYIFKGKCRDVELKHLTNENIKSLLKVCYVDNKLYLDPSSYNLAKKMGTVNIPYSPLWSKGFLYKKISSSGYTKLNEVTIKVKR